MKDKDHTTSPFELCIDIWYINNLRFEHLTNKREGIINQPTRCVVRLKL